MSATALFAGRWIGGCWFPDGDNEEARLVRKLSLLCCRQDRYRSAAGISLWFAYGRAADIVRLRLANLSDERQAA